VYIAPAGQSAGKFYAVIPLGAQPGFKGTWRLRAHDTQTTYTVAAPKSGKPGCTCPDHETRGTMCKHIRALAAIGLLRAPKDKPAPSRAKGLKAHAKNARAAIAEAKKLDPAARRHLAAMGPPPAPRPLEEIMPDAGPGILYPVFGKDEGGRQKAESRPSVPVQPSSLILQPSEFAAGFRQAVAAHLALKRGALIECAACRYPFDPQSEGSAPLALCGPCLLEEKGGRS
jgi:hypothetical protein